MKNKNNKKLQHYYTQNGDELWKIYYSYCKVCNEYINESFPRYESKRGNWYCIECAFIKKYMTSQDYMRYACGGSLMTRAEVYNGKIYYLSGNQKYFFWEKPDKKQRYTTEYRLWRKSVYERDNYTCQKCGKIGGTLNAHHIKPYIKYKKLRFDINNGITLCIKCHKLEHKVRSDKK